LRLSKLSVAAEASGNDAIDADDEVGLISVTSGELGGDAGSDETPEAVLAASSF
jgi:hypothetical protein